MPKEAAPAELLAMAGDEIGISVFHFHPRRYRVLVTWAEKALDENNGRRGKSALNTPTGQKLLERLPTVHMESGIRKAVEVSTAIGIPFQSVRGKDRHQALYWAQRLCNAQCAKEPGACCQELHKEVVQAIEGTGNHPNTCWPKVSVQR